MNLLNGAEETKKEYSNSDELHLEYLSEEYYDGSGSHNIIALFREREETKEERKQRLDKEENRKKELRGLRKKQWEILNKEFGE